MTGTNILIHQSQHKSVVFSITFAAMLLAYSPLVQAEQSQTFSVEQTDGDHFQMRREGDMIIRLDKRTGAMSTCRMQGSSLVCRIAADERSALEEEIASLQSRLENQDGAKKPGPETGLQSPNPTEDKRPDSDIGKQPGNSFDEELDKMVDLSSKVLRRFFTVMKELRNDLAQ